MFYLSKIFPCMVFLLLILFIVTLPYMGQHFVVTFIGYALTEVCYPLCFLLHTNLHHRDGIIRLLLSGTHKSKQAWVVLVGTWLQTAVSQRNCLKYKMEYCIITLTTVAEPSAGDKSRRIGILQNGVVWKLSRGVWWTVHRCVVDSCCDLCPMMLWDYQLHWIILLSVHLKREYH